MLKADDSGKKKKDYLPPGVPDHECIWICVIIYNILEYHDISILFAEARAFSVLFFFNPADPQGIT